MRRLWLAAVAILCIAAVAGLQVALPAIAASTNSGVVTKGLTNKQKATRALKNQANQFAKLTKQMRRLLALEKRISNKHQRNTAIR